MAGKRDELERKAMQAVQRAGFARLSFRTLANEAGVKSSSVHYYFPEKADLANALIDAYTAQFEQRLGDIDAAGLRLLGKLDAFAGLFAEVLDADNMCLCGMMAAETENLSAESRQRLGRFFDRTEGWLRDVFREHQDELQVAMKPRQLALALMAALEGAVLVDRIGGSRQRLGAVRALIASWV